MGSFAGYFKTRVECQKLCKQNYQEKCYGYMYEPQKRGTCSIFQYSLNANFYNSPNSKVSLFKKCGDAVVTGCCGELTQSSTSFLANGDMSFTYNDNKCRSTATVTCGQPKGLGFEKNAAIVVNRINYLKIGWLGETIHAQASCSNGTWKMGNPPLIVSTLECQLSDPP
uniref:C6 domain-containing protein n=1 Tax=Panagrolaimus superbus TaxID=310955 RepID=A0A914Z498_9BILA